MSAQDEARRNARYLLSPALEGSFGAIAVTVKNLGIRGMQIEHAEALKLGSQGRITITVPERREKVVVMGRVAWSRLAQTPDAAGRLRYHSGIRFLEDALCPSEVLVHLLGRGEAAIDTEGMRRKEEARRLREESRAARTMKYVPPTGPDIPADQQLLVEHAIRQLRSNPDEAQKWYQRAKFAPILDRDKTAYREDIVAIWEYLGRTIEIEVVRRVFETTVGPRNQ